MPLLFKTTDERQMKIFFGAAAVLHAMIVSGEHKDIVFGTAGTKLAFDTAEAFLAEAESRFKPAEPQAPAT